MDKIIDAARQRDPEKKLFLQALEEITDSLKPLFEKEPTKYLSALQQLVEPEQQHIFRVSWYDDEGKLQTNRGFRVQANSALGPYKGGLRFHPTVRLDVIMFLATEQTLKNALTGLAMGGGKGGSDFNPKGKSNGEVRRFCQAFMQELHRHIGPQTDVPAGDIGVGGREIGFLYGQFQKLRNTSLPGVLTGKPLHLGGSNIREEATGYGVSYMADVALRRRAAGMRSGSESKVSDPELGSGVKGRRVLISGSGNVALWTVRKQMALGATVLTVSDSRGYIYEPEGFTLSQWEQLYALKAKRRGRLAELKDSGFLSKNGQYADGSVWDLDGHKASLALPCATQNEVQEKHAQLLLKNGVQAVVEGANMPLSPEAIAVIQKAGGLYIPGKAANAGGVATSGFEMAQNAQRAKWTREEVKKKLRGVMEDIFENIETAAVTYGKSGGKGLDGADYIDYQLGANIAGFLRIAEAMKHLGHAD